MKTKRTSAKTLILFIAIITAALLVPAMLKAGNLEPSAVPGPTMKTLDEIPPTWSQKLPEAQRFVIVMGGAAVLDKETGLVWERSPETTARTWVSAVIHCYNKVVGGRKGWRLPTVAELASLVDTTQSSPALPSGHPFQNVQYFDYYWSGAEYAGDPGRAWGMYMGNGYVSHYDKNYDVFVWAVRGGQ